MYDQSPYIFSEDHQRGTFSANPLTTKYKGFIYLFFILFDFLTCLFWLYSLFNLIQKTTDLSLFAYLQQACGFSFFEVSEK